MEQCRAPEISLHFTQSGKSQDQQEKEFQVANTQGNQENLGAPSSRHWKFQFGCGPNLGAQKGPWVVTSPLPLHSGGAQKPSLNPARARPELPTDSLAPLWEFCHWNLLKEQLGPSNPQGFAFRDTNVQSLGFVTPSRDRDTGENQQEREGRAARLELLGRSRNFHE